MTQEHEGGAHEGSADTAREGADPEDMTSGGSGGAQGTETQRDQMDQDTDRPSVGDDDVQMDRTGEPVTKPDQSTGSPGEMRE